MGALYGILGGADRTELRALSDRLAHRGRAAAEWSPGRDLHLGIRGARRIVDVQEHGPVAFEGAIDNRGEIARLLGRRHPEAAEPADDAGLAFELIDSFGPETLARLAGQFALAFWHGPERRLLLARDRIGYAPLYFTVFGDRFAFASEYKALLALSGVVARPDLDTLQAAHATGWVSPGFTCLHGVFPVAPGSCLEVRADRIWGRRYGDSPPRAAEGGKTDRASRLRESLFGALRRQAAGYGRLGVLLTGGRGSGFLAAAMRAVAEGREVHAFTAGYGPDDRDLVAAVRMATELGIRHHPVVLDPDDLETFLPWMVWHLEEPVGGEETGYLFAAAREAARHVTLVVTGSGLDGLVDRHGRHRLAGLASRYLPVRKPIDELYDYAHRGVAPASLTGRVLKAAFFHGHDFPPARFRGAVPMPPRSSPDFLRRRSLAEPYRSSIERLCAGTGVRLATPYSDPEFVETAVAIPRPLKIQLSSALVAPTQRDDRLAHRLRMSEALERMAVELLSPGAVRARGWLDPAYVAALLRRNRGQPYGEKQSRRILSLLLSETWARGFLDRSGAAPEHPLPPVRRIETASAARGEPATGRGSAGQSVGRPAR